MQNIDATDRQTSQVAWSVCLYLCVTRVASNEPHIRRGCTWAHLANTIERSETSRCLAQRWSFSGGRLTKRNVLQQCSGNVAPDGPVHATRVLYG